MSHPIPNFIVKAQVAALQHQPGLHDILQSYGTSLSALEQKVPVFEAHQFARFLRDCFTFFDDESMGFATKPLRVGTFRMMCYATISCTDVRQLILRMNEYFRLLSDEFNFELREKGEEVEFIINHSPTEKTHHEAFIVELFIYFWRYWCWMIDSPILLNRIHLDVPQTQLREQMQSVFNCPMYFAQKQNSLLFASHYLNKPIKQSVESLGPFLANAPERLLSHYQKDDSVSSQVRRLLNEISDFDNINLETVSQELALSSQSLSRRLKREGHSFQQLKDKVRKAKTIQLLLTTDLTMSEISQRLGYSEDTVFYRTFKKWTGKTPASFRNKHS